MGGTRVLHLIHFNDVYNIEAGARDPVGGAAKFVAKVKSLAPLNPLVLFSGDCFNPSLMSTITLGKQMVPVLNAVNVQAACVGNHDWDMGLGNFVQLSAQCKFPWLLANVLDKATGKPMAGAKATVMLEWAGVRVGLLGLAEAEWVDTLSVVSPEEITYLDFVQEGRRLAQELKAAGAEVVLALTHMRAPNDTKLLTEVEEIDAVLGGHDHNYEVAMIEPHHNLLVKSGTDFREFTHLTITLPAAASKTAPSAADGTTQPAAGSAAEKAAAAAEKAVTEALVAAEAAQERSTSVTSSGMLLADNRPVMKWQRVAITSDIADDPDMAKVVEEFAAVMGEHMDQRVGWTLTDLDGRFTTVRTKESNLANLMTDVLRRALHADVVLLNSGTFRSDTIHPAGPLTCRDLVSILPMMDDSIVIQVTGKQLLAALENAVSHYPQLEGRFPQVSGVRFSFDPAKPPGQRIILGSVTVGDKALDPDAAYRLATKEYLAEGKDGYTALEGCLVLVDSEDCPPLPTAMRHFFLVLEILGAMDKKVQLLGMAKHWHQKALGTDGHDQQQQQQQELARVHQVCVRHPDSGGYAVAPAVDGRITCIKPYV